MRKGAYFFAVIITAFAISIPAFAQTTSTGSAGENVSQTSGNINPGGIGGFAGGASSGQYATKGKTESGGTATANGFAGSTVTTNTPTSFGVDAKTQVNSATTGYGSKVKMGVDGVATQGTQGQLGSGNNVAMGWNSTAATYDEKGKALNDPKMSGSAATTGKTTGSVNQTANSNASAIESNGSSTAQLTQKGFDKCGDSVKGGVTASGSGGVGISSMLGGGSNQSFSAGAGAQGATTFNANGNQFAKGSQSMNGTTATTMDPKTGSVQATSTMSSSAKASGH